VCEGLESAISTVGGKPEAVPRLVEAINAWSTAGVVHVDAYSPPIRDFLATAAGPDSGAAPAGPGGGGSASAASAGPSAAETCLAIANGLIASGTVGIPLAKMAKEALKGQPTPAVGTAVTRAVLTVCVGCV
jgi:hypothetical protein